ncbi:MAG TPA: VOC family protein [Acidimicrobiales bacterium]|nr:VOC family protein [Acidimicrobiales bacterium]
MTTSHTRSDPAVSPYLYYEDGDAAIDWLVRVFGCRERLRVPKPDGRFGHGEVEIGGGVVMLGSPPGFRRADRSYFGVYVHVDDVDGHVARARTEGATITDEPADKPYGERIYGALDLEGNQWWFAQPLAS